MGLATKVSVICLAAAVAANVVAQVPSHEEDVVRSTYGTLSFLCGTQFPARAAIDQLHGRDVNQKRIDREVADATPVFEITQLETGTIASIAGQNWSTRFSFPEVGTKNNVVLDGALGTDGYGDETMKANWRIASVKWSTDDSYTTERIATIQALTVDQAVKKNAPYWTTPATYTRYATFQVAVTFQGRTVGPYTASFFFGKDANGNEIVAPQDAFVGQVLWPVTHSNAYPTELLTSKLREQPVMAQWIQANKAQSCSSTHSGLCCAHGRCALPDTQVARDLATPLNHSN